MSFSKLEKPIGADPDYEAYHAIPITIGSPKGLAFKMEIMCVTTHEFEPNAKLMMKETIKAINALLAKQGMPTCH